MEKKSVFRGYVFLSLFLCLIFPVKATTSYWDGHSYSTSWYNPSGSVYYIQSAEDLCGLSYLLRPGNYRNFAGKEVVLMVDIDLNGYEWETLGCIKGSYYYAFNGVFNGNGKTISGLSITKMNNGTLRTTGLFGVLMEQGTVIKNLIVEGNINLNVSGTADIGAISGTSMATIYNCKSSVNISVNSSNASADINVGGIVGKAYGLIHDCQSRGYVQIRQDAISGCRIGGIAGSSVTADIGAGIIRCKSSSDITIIGGKDALVGGISSLIREHNSDNLYTGCIDIEGSHFAYAGGIIASMSSEAKNCLMLGSFTGYGDYYYKGAIMATKESDVIINNCYYKEGLTNMAGYGMAVAEDELLSGETLLGLNASIWSFSRGEYPDLNFEFEDLIEKPSVERMELDPAVLTLEEGGSQRLYPIFYPSETTDNVTWSSSNDYVAVVSSSGLVVARNGGEAYILATTSQGILASCRVSVEKSVTTNEIIRSTDIEIRGIEGEILINTSVPEKAYVYTLGGEMINSEDLRIGENRISSPKGIFIVKTGKLTQKVIVI